MAAPANRFQMTLVLVQVAEEGQKGHGLSPAQWGCLVYSGNVYF